jgi:D-alanyl-lipoteichoic acid acyltransferase DltB (MBOAT superfamily)
MAIGIALLLGFHFNLNFNSPYKSASITEFWRRWHISLSSWLRDYLYISLGGNRKGKFRQYLNLIITMFLGGLWHGASWNFVLWGTFHGIALAVHKIWLFIRCEVGVSVGRLYHRRSCMLRSQFPLETA